VDERRTHYQLSFTSGQALAVFLVLLGALAGAYFFGVMTGLAGRDAPAAAAERPAPDAPSEDAFPTPVLGVEPGRSARAAPTLPLPAEAPGAGTGTVQLFEDRAEGDSMRESVPVVSPPAPGAARDAAGGFWVQVVSLTSEREARSRTARLVARGYPAVVAPGPAAGRGIVYRVRVGPFPRREEAARAAARLTAEEKTETWIVPSGR